MTDPRVIAQAFGVDPRLAGEDQGAEEVERFSAELARRVADLVHEGAYRIDPEHARLIAENCPHGWQGSLFLGPGPNPLVIEYRILNGGHVRLDLRTATGVRVWDATLRP